MDWHTRFGPSISLSYILYYFGYGDFQTEVRNTARWRPACRRTACFRMSWSRSSRPTTCLSHRGTGARQRINAPDTQTTYDARNGAGTGLATVADVYRTETQVAQAQLNLTRSRGDFEKARGQLSIAVGLPVNDALTVQKLAGLPKVREITTSLSSLLDRAKANRPDLVAAEAQARSARANATATARAGLPTIEVSALGGHNSFGDNRPAVSNYAIGLNVRIPIFTGFRDTYRVRQAEAQAAQAEADTRRPVPANRT